MLDPSQFRILLVDDTLENIDVLSEVLSDYKRSVATNGPMALKIAVGAKPDLILLDIMMPVMDGYEVFRRLQEDPKTKEIPVIFLTALSQMEDEVKGLELGAVDYITKPIMPPVVLARVNTQLELKQKREQLIVARRQADDLLRNILPQKVIKDLKAAGKSEPQLFPDVTVLFSDIVGFALASSSLEPPFLIDELNTMFTAFDEIIEDNHCERIKTIGDAYLAVCGLPEANENHAANIVQSARQMIAFMNERNEAGYMKWQIRVGIHSGPVMGAVVGTKKYIYDVFGDTVNTASRMESHSEPMKINLSETTCELLHGKYAFAERELLEVKGKGAMKMYFLKA